MNWLIRANEFPILLEDGAYLLFDVHAAEERIEGLAAGHEIVRVVRATGRRWNQVFDARFYLRNGAVAEETALTLEKHHSLKRCGGHFFELLLVDCDWANVRLYQAKLWPKVGMETVTILRSQMPAGCPS